MDINLDRIDETLNPIHEDFIANKEMANLAKGTAIATGGGYGIYKTAEHALSGLADTEGYGNLSPMEKYKTGGKIPQIGNNALQASRGHTVRGALYEAGHSFVTGQPLDLKAAKSSVAEVESLLSNANLPSQTRADFELNLKSRVKNLAKREGLSANVKMSIGKPINFPLSDDFKPSKFKVNKLITKIEPSMKGFIGKTLPAMEHSGQQIVDFKSYASGDPRVRKVADLLHEGKLLDAKKASREAHYYKGSKKKGTFRTIKPDRIKTKSGFMPVNKKGESMKMKLRKIGTKLYKGKRVPIYRLGFVPRLRYGLSAKLEYVAGQHWQYMDFAKIDGRYVPVRGGMRDVHNLMPNKFGATLSKLEAKLVSPVINYSDWTYNIRTQKRSPNKLVKKAEKMLYRTTAARKPQKIYGSGTSAARSDYLKAWGKKSLPKQIARAALKVLSRGRI